MFVNEAWDRFAEENGGAPACLGDALLGTRWLDHIAGEEVRATHAALLARALSPSSGARGAIVQVGECNTAITSALVSTRLQPVLLHGIEPTGVAIVHETVRARPIEEVYDPVARGVESYRDGEGRLTQCSCCRRLRDPVEGGSWDLVREVVQAPPTPVVHGLCELCAELHFRCAHD